MSINAKCLIGNPALRTIFLLLVAILCFGGCGASRPLHDDSVLTPTSFVSRVEHQCHVAYTHPRVIGEPLGFQCGETASRAHFSVLYTRILRCAVFVTLVADTGLDRAQGCSSPARHPPGGTITCESDGTLAVAARTLPRMWSATVLLNSGQEVTSNILSLSAIDRSRWGGVYFNVLRSGAPMNAVLVERDQAGHVFHRLSLTPIGRCVGNGRTDGLENFSKGIQDGAEASLGPSS